MQAEKYDYLMVLRGLSAIAVVFCHMPMQLHTLIGVTGFDWVLHPFGYIPVLIFFSMSGYLITLGFLTDRHNPDSLKGLTHYYRSRAFRILPLYYFSIIFCALIFWQQTQEAPLRVLALFSFIENYKPETGIIFNHVYWTMPVEMLYFLSAPLIFLALKKATLHMQDWIIFLVVTILFLLIAAFIFDGLPFDKFGYKVTRRQWSMMARFDFWYNLAAFVLGGVCVFVVKNRSYTANFVKYRSMIKICSVIFIIAILSYCSAIEVMQLDSGRVSYFIAFGLIPSLALFMLSVVILNETQITRPRQWVKHLEYLGLLSYGIYLFHMPIYSLLKELSSYAHLTPSNEIMSLAVLITTLLFSKISYQYIEVPFLHLHRKQTHGTRKTCNI